MNKNGRVAYRVYADGRIVHEDDFAEDNQELDMGGGDDYEECKIPVELEEYLMSLEL